MKELKRAMFIMMLVFVGWSCGDDDSDGTPMPDPEPPSAPTGVSTNDVATDGFTINWSAVSGASSYSVQVASDNAFGTIVANESGLTTTSAAVSSLSSETEYFVRVNATNDDGTSDYSSTVSVTTEAEPDPNPGPDPGPDPSPSNGATIGGEAFEPTTNEARTADGNTQLVFSDGAATITVTTNASAAGTYTISSSGDHTASYQNGDSVFVATSGALEVTSVSPTMSGTYEFEADFSFVNGRTMSTISITGGSFVNVVISSADPLTAPVAGDATDVTNTGFTANWGTVSDALSYFVDVASDDAFANLIVDNQAVLGTSLVVADLTTGSNYYFRVRATNVLTTSDNSNVSTVATTGVVDPGPDPSPGIGEYIIEVTQTGPDQSSTTTIDYNDDCQAISAAVNGTASGFAFDADATYDYDNNGRLVKITSVTSGITTTIEYNGFNANGFPSEVVLGNSFTGDIVYSYTFDSEDRVQSISASIVGQNITYTYNYTGDNVTSIDQSGDLGSGTITFDYDSNANNFYQDYLEQGISLPEWYLPYASSKDLVTGYTSTIAGVTTEVSLVYEFNSNGNPSQITTTTNAAGQTSELIVAYTYAADCN